MPHVIRSAQPQDLSAIQTLLKSVDLSTAGVAQHLRDFLVIEDAGHIIASAGLEVHETAALLRSVAVQAPYRSRGLAKALVDRLLAQARLSRVHNVYLLTTSAQQYFQRMGFETVPREAVDPTVAASAEFGDSCCATAVAMRLQLFGGGQKAG